MNQTLFERKIKPLFQYIGFVATVIFSIAYIIVIAVMIVGLEAAPTVDTFVGFLIANLITGACISVSLMLQGQTFAKNKEENHKILEQYYKKKEVKLHSMTFYWTIAILKVIFIRLLMVAAMTYIVIDICWQGNGQYTYFLMALFNILMFLGFGFIGLVSMYDKFNEKYIPWVLKQQEQKDEGKAKAALEEAKADGTEQRDGTVDSNSRSNILESVNSNGDVSLSESVFLDSVRSVHNVLGSPVHPSNTVTAITSGSVKENI